MMIAAYFEVEEGRKEREVESLQAQYDIFRVQANARVDVHQKSRHLAVHALEELERVEAHLGEPPQVRIVQVVLEDREEFVDLHALLELCAQPLRWIGIVGRELAQSSDGRVAEAANLLALIRRYV